jgi:4-methyl-5(b-hydroxyethyl)-thiazole monophosphate biosynthesis
MDKKALIILAEGFEEIEAVSCIDILRRGSIAVTVAGLNQLEVTGSRGLRVRADKILAEAANNFDACILPGGSLGAKNLAASIEVKTLLGKMHQGGKIIAAICAAPAVVLASTGILKNKSATCYPGLEKNFTATTKYKTDAVVVDGNIITSRGPGTTFKFALTIVEILADKAIRDKVSKAILAD